MTVNQRAVGSSPTGGAGKIPKRAAIRQISSLFAAISATQELANLSTETMLKEIVFNSFHKARPPRPCKSNTSA